MSEIIFQLLTFIEESDGQETGLIDWIDVSVFNYYVFFYEHINKMLAEQRTPPLQQWERSRFWLEHHKKTMVNQGNMDELLLLQTRAYNLAEFSTSYVDDKAIAPMIAYISLHGVRALMNITRLYIHSDLQEVIVLQERMGYMARIERMNPFLVSELEMLFESGEKLYEHNVSRVYIQSIVDNQGNILLVYFFDAFRVIYYQLHREPGYLIDLSRFEQFEVLRKQLLDPNNWIYPIQFTNTIDEQAARVYGYSKNASNMQRRRRLLSYRPLCFVVKQFANIMFNININESKGFRQFQNTDDYIVSGNDNIHAAAMSSLDGLISSFNQFVTP